MKNQNLLEKKKLTREEMKEVTGGTNYNCSCTNGGGNFSCSGFGNCLDQASSCCGGNNPSEYVCS